MSVSPLRFSLQSSIQRRAASESPAATELSFPRSAARSPLRSGTTSRKASTIPVLLEALLISVHSSISAVLTDSFTFPSSHGAAMLSLLTFLRLAKRLTFTLSPSIKRQRRSPSAIRDLRMILTMQSKRECL